MLKEIKSLKQWVNWKAVERDGGKIDKLPINPNTGEMAKSNDSSTWGSYELAKANEHKYNGIGFMFQNGYFGVDIDNVREDIDRYLRDEHENNIVSEFVDILNSYVETSISGNGIHIICKGRLPDGGRRKKNVEMYDENRFFVMTEKPLGSRREIRECSEEIIYLHSKYIGAPAPTQKKQKIAAINNLSSDELLEHIKNSKQASAFEMLNSGNWEGFYSSQSEADLAFCNMLAYWTARDYSKMDQMFRSSGLYRDKWDERRGGKTYGEATLSKAIDGCTNVFEPYSIKLIESASGKVAMRRYSFDDTGNAERFFDWNKDTVKYSYSHKRWYFYDGKKWTHDECGAMKSKVDDILRVMKAERELYDEDAIEAFDKHIRYSRNHRGKENVLKEMEHKVPLGTEDFDRDIFTLNTQNCILDLKNMKMRKHNPDEMLSKISYVNYKENAECPKWERFLQEIMNNDLELIEYLQKAVGYSLTASTEEQCVFIPYGNGRNGKSVFIKVISNILGEYAINIQPESIMVKPGANNSASSDIARLAGARFVTTTEPNEGVRLNEGLIKQLSGGDRITARFLYGNEFEFTPGFKLWMATNHKPIIRGKDEGIWRRMHLIPFDVQIPKEKVNKNLEAELMAEAPGILIWAIKGFVKWRKEGLKMAKRVEEASNEYRSEMDVVSLFLEECVERGVNYSVKASDLYAAYKKWAEANNQYEMSNTKFGTELGKRIEKKRIAEGIYYIGIKLLDELMPYEIKMNYS